MQCRCLNISVDKQNKTINKKINGVISKEYFENISFLNVNEFEVFLKICDLDQLEGEINCQMDDAILKQIRKKYKNWSWISPFSNNGIFGI